MNPPAASSNRRIRVFISSTFRDMIAERDELMAQVWPELRRLCRERHVELVEVDLRWGIAEEQSTRKETLKLCLDEIRACRPFFIGLLGERYGWVPGDDAFTADLKEEQPWLNGQQGKSVTELEILHGVLNNPEMAGRAFFYFRDPAYLATLPADARHDFSPENLESAEKLRLLKNRIRESGSPVREAYPDPRQLARLVLNDLRDAIEKQFPMEEVPDALTREDQEHDAFAEIRRRTYIGRADYFDALDRHAAGADGPLVLLGESGTGKSALLANWLARWRQGHPRHFVFQHYIGGTPDSADHWKLITRLVSGIKRWSDDPDPVPSDRDALLRDFPVWLAKARARAEHTGVRCIVVLDALNQLDEQAHAQLLGWLPEHPFTGPLRLIVSTLPGKPNTDDPLAVVRSRNWSELIVQPLTLNERKRMIADYLIRFGKKLDGSRLDRLASAPAAANPLYLKILLDELRVTGTHERLDERLTDYLAATDIPVLLRQVLARYQRDYERDRPGLVAEALSLIYAARRGLTETELLRILRAHDQDQLPSTIWSPLRAALEDTLVDRGGILNFSHDFLRSAVESVFAPDETQCKALRLRLADYFAEPPIIARSCDELPWLLGQAKSYVRLRACLLEIDRFSLILKRDRLELRHYWVHELKEEQALGQAYLDSFDHWQKNTNLTPKHIVETANGIGFFLDDAALYKEAEMLFRHSLHLAGNLFPADPLLRAEIICRLGGLLKEKNCPAEAEQLLRSALEIYETYPGKLKNEVAVTLSTLALVLRDQKRLDEAEELFRRVLIIDEKLLGTDHENTATTLNNLALVLGATDRQNEAEALFRRALDIQDRCHGFNHPNVALAANNLAALLRKTKRYADAVPFNLRAVAIWESNYGQNHPLYAVGLTNLALLHTATQEFERAEPLYRRALCIFEKCHGTIHPYNARVLSYLADLLQVTNRLPEAEALLRRAVKIVLQTSRGAALTEANAAATKYVRILLALGYSVESATASLKALDPEKLLTVKLLSPTAVNENQSPDEIRRRSFDYFVRGEYEKSRALLIQLRAINYDLASTNVHLARIAFLSDDHASVAKHIADAWTQHEKAEPHILPRIIWMQFALSMFERNASTHQDLSFATALGRLKIALDRSNAHMEWAMGPVLAHIQPKLPADQHALLTALVAALCDRSNLPALDAFPAWRDAVPQPLD